MAPRHPGTYAVHTLYTRCAHAVHTGPPFRPNCSAERTGYGRERVRCHHQTRWRAAASMCPLDLPRRQCCPGAALVCCSCPAAQGIGAGLARTGACARRSPSRAAMSAFMRASEWFCPTSFVPVWPRRGASRPMTSAVRAPRDRRARVNQPTRTRRARAQRELCRRGFAALRRGGEQQPPGHRTPASATAIAPMLPTPGRGRAVAKTAAARTPQSTRQPEHARSHATRRGGGGRTGEEQDGVRRRRRERGVGDAAQLRDRPAAVALVAALPRRHPRRAATLGRGADKHSVGARRVERGPECGAVTSGRAAADGGPAVCRARVVAAAKRDAVPQREDAPRRLLTGGGGGRREGGEEAESAQSGKHGARGTKRLWSLITQTGGQVG